jgi:hypothetical protein
METDMNLPIQSAPVMRGQDRGSPAVAPHAVSHAIGQSQAGTTSPACGLCALLPAPYNAICQAVCGGIIH